MLGWLENVWLIRKEGTQKSENLTKPEECSQTSLRRIYLISSLRRIGRENLFLIFLVLPAAAFLVSLLALSSTAQDATGALRVT
jgi:hypothetical protein